MIDPKSRSKEWILESCGKNKVNELAHNVYQ